MVLIKKVTKNSETCSVWKYSCLLVTAVTFIWANSHLRYFSLSSYSTISEKSRTIVHDKDKLNTSFTPKSPFLNEKNEVVNNSIKESSKDPLLSNSTDHNAQLPTSIFDCDSKYRKCKYFYPSKFFSNNTVNDNSTEKHGASADGRGSKFLYIYEDIEDLRTKGELWRSMPRVGTPTYKYDETKINIQTGKPFHRHNVTFIHVHKAGGTTVISLMRKMRGKIAFTRHPLYNWSVDRNHALSDSHIKTATKYKSPPQQWSKDDHTMFAFIRDPLDRFISSIGQAMGAQGSEGSNVATILRKTCIKDTEHSIENSRYTLQCCIDYIKKNGFYFEIHFTPQAIEIAFATRMYPVPVAVFQFEESYKDVLIELGMDPNLKNRDGSDERYRKMPLLTKMSSADYTDDLKRQVCELYEVDVIMSRTLGWGFSSCEGFV